MKTTLAKSRLVILVALVVLSTSFMGCSKESPELKASTNTANLKESVSNYLTTESTAGMAEAVSLPLEDLSEAEEAALIIMREEELLAHDVYLGMSLLYTKPVFKNITKSEAVHTEAIRKLLVKYSIVDPAANHVTGQFTNPGLQVLYNSLIATGSQSLLKGLTVGATIEDLDIYDLKQHLLEVDNHDIIKVFNNLKFGSENHLRAFYANILALGGTYTPQYITQEEFNLIINQ